VYELEHQSQDGTRARYTSVETIAAYYLEQIVTIQMQGPYFLGGYSFGGVVAFEMAHQLQRRGEQVALLVLLDSPYPPKAEPVAYHAAMSRSRRSLAAFAHELHRYVRQAMRLWLQNGFGDPAWKLKAHVSGLITGNTARCRKTFENLICRTYVALGHTLPPHLRSRYILDVYHRALAQYVPEPYRGAAVYIKCEQSSGHRRDVWETLIGGGLTVHEVPGDHLDVRRQSHVHFWAEKLNGWICRAQSTG
jgi:thioesterase domain-containing protein